MSYYRVLGLNREPFSTSPDPAFFYQSQQHRTALANLLIECRLKRGFSVVLGDIGTGKTTLGRKLIQQLRERPGFIFHMVLDPTYPSQTQFFESIARTLQIEITASEPTLLDYREALQKYLFKKAIEERQVVVLLIDEAHKMTTEALELLRILLNYETNDAKLLQLVLFGQLELVDLLNDMPNLTDRISYRCHLKTLTLEETIEMVAFRLNEAGYEGSQSLFEDEAVADIYEACNGYLRRITMLCHKALRVLVAQEGRVVDRFLVQDLIKEECETGWETAKKLRKNASSV